jgi:hypothetical protein
MQAVRLAGRLTVPEAESAMVDNCSRVTCHSSQGKTRREQQLQEEYCCVIFTTDRVLMSKGALDGPRIDQIINYL